MERYHSKKDEEKRQENESILADRIESCLVMREYFYNRKDDSKVIYTDQEGRDLKVASSTRFNILPRGIARHFWSLPFYRCKKGNEDVQEFLHNLSWMYPLLRYRTKTFLQFQNVAELVREIDDSSVEVVSIEAHPRRIVDYLRGKK